ncbi:OmpH family outer membrane protein [Seonamhaeicola aphaedonensis]|uniref:Periplasmic chaperone for outer membrane proteins Skp n=1 Tax=Seonamhaeicola aphaedonensis TaxID=1461338 RepID=A0A3D9HHK8_9FLAO|nr:OmpH family outer membrane protein [Seonamhaeicola aphaedonensis]RED48968.1 periplasmic chaperone for outer membrane proteins Skp [Seonamhaeicola aphaedonensis]
MKYIFFALFVVVVFTSCQQQKIGFVDNSTLINEIQEKKDLEAKFKGREDAFNKKRDSMIAAYQIELKEAQLKAQKMSQSKLQALSQEIQQKEQLLGQKIQLEQQQISQAFQTEIDSLISKVKDFVKDYGKANGYTYILGTSDGASSVLYGTDENNLTQTILEALDVEYNKK